MAVRANHGRLRVRTPRQEVPPCKGPETGRAAMVKREKGGQLGEGAVNRGGKGAPGGGQEPHSL